MAESPYYVDNASISTLIRLPKVTTRSIQNLEKWIVLPYEQGLEYLIELIQDPDSARGQIVIQTELVIRESTTRPGGHNE